MYLNPASNIYGLADFLLNLINLFYRTVVIKWDNICNRLCTMADTKEAFNNRYKFGPFHTAVFLY
jgi:hypothetical protein